MRLLSYLLRSCVLIAFCSIAWLRAQETWTAVASGTTRNLWGVTYGEGQFVAVGEGGTILTSVDGASWTTRVSGTTAWLTSVAQGFGQYVAVGERGVVLVSRDGVTWSSLDSGTDNRGRDRLNVVRFLGAEFMMYGERNAALELRFPERFNSVGLPLDQPGPWWRDFAVGLNRYVIAGENGLSVLEPSHLFHPSTGVVTLPAGVSRLSGILFVHDEFVAVGAGGAIVTSSDALQWTRQTSGTSADLQAIAAFNNTLIAVGTNGTVLSVDELGRWRVRATPTGELLLGIAANDRVAVAVGGSGTIIRALATHTAPTITQQPVTVTETIGGAASFVVRARGSLPFTYQWSVNGLPLLGENRPTLIRAPITAVDGGSYTVTVTNVAGTIRSSVANLNVLPAPPSVVDATFRGDAALDGSPTALLALPDGSVLVGTFQPGQLVKLRSDGAIDSTWAKNSYAGTSPSPNAHVDVLVLQPDGRILVGGQFTTHNDQPRLNLVRLNANGTLDTSFVPAAEAAGGPTSALALQADGKILVANGRPTPVRLLTNGGLDSSFQPLPLPQATASFGIKRDYLIHGIGVSPNGGIVIAGVASLQTASHEFGLATSEMRRLKADGAFDDTFTPVQWPGQFANLRALDDGSYALIERVRAQANFGGFDTRIRRIGFPGYTESFLSPSIRTTFIYPDGRVLHSTSASQQNPVRLTAQGTMDTGFTGGIGPVSAITATADGRVIVAGDFDVFDGTTTRRVARLNAVTNPVLNAPRVLGFSADKNVVRYGEPVTLRVAVVGSGPLTYEWFGSADGMRFSGDRTTSPIRTVTFSEFSSGHTVKVIVRNVRGEAVGGTLDFSVLPDTPVITSQPTRVSTQTGRSVTLAVEKNSTAGETIAEWRRDGVLLPRLGDPWLHGQTYSLSSVTAADAGNYTLTLRNALGATVSTTPIRLTVDDSSRFVNLSTRVVLNAGEPRAIVGFTIPGRQTRTVMIRGIGPGLARFGVASPLADPQIALYDQSGRARNGSFNDDWSDSQSATFTRLGAFPLESGSKDAAFPAVLDPGSYTVVLTAPPGQTGTALIEVYENDNATDRMINVSTRAFVGPAAPAIAGLSIRGVVAKKVLLRAVGPGLAAFGVGAPLSNPRIRLITGDGTSFASNDDWETSPNAAELRAAMGVTGAFPLAAGSRDAALLVTLPPGNHTAVVESADGSAGVVLVEAYEVD